MVGVLRCLVSLLILRTLMKQACAISVAVLIALAHPARAQDAPPPDVLNRIIDGLGKPVPRVPPVFEQAGTDAPDPVCGLQAFGMTLANGTSRQRRYDGAGR